MIRVMLVLAFAMIFYGCDSNPTESNKKEILTSPADGLYHYTASIQGTTYLLAMRVSGDGWYSITSRYVCPVVEEAGSWKIESGMFTKTSIQRRTRDGCGANWSAVRRIEWEAWDIRNITKDSFDLGVAEYNNWFLLTKVEDG